MESARVQALNNVGMMVFRECAQHLAFHHARDGMATLQERRRPF